MVLWEKLAAGGGGAMLLGALLLIGFARGWFSDHYTYTIEGGEGFMLSGIFLVAIGVLALGWGAWTAI